MSKLFVADKDEAEKYVNAIASNTSELVAAGESFGADIDTIDEAIGKNLVRVKGSLKELVSLLEDMGEKAEYVATEFKAGVQDVDDMQNVDYHG